MRRPAFVLTLWAVVAATAISVPAASADPAPAEASTTTTAPSAEAAATRAEEVADLPAGFTDGEPVGGTELPAADLPVTSDQPGTAAAPATTRAVSNTRYFGEGPWSAIEAASDATARCSVLSGPQLTALVVSPIFKESSAATSPSSAPSPMTLSRYDEWTGTYSTSTNKNANYTLYAFKDPNTEYQRAFWHPGIGIWQYDSAGVGAPYTAVERMDVRVVAGDVAAGMASRYCNPPTSVVGHGAPFTVQERRDAAWWPWWAGSTTRSCPLCQAEYDRMTATTPYFGNVSRVSGISATGGAVERSCALAGVSGTVECWYVNPAVGVIQGATGWATVAPDGRSDPTVAPTPLSAPFYVIKRNGAEERHWLRADTGYGTDLSGSRLLGKNERVRSNQTGSGITWRSTSGLCDLTARRGSCGSVAVPPTNPVPAPLGVTSTVASVGGTYRPVAADFDGDGRGDILWYAPGAAGDALWQGKGNGQFTSLEVNIGTSYDEVVPLDFNGDGRDDLVFYQRTSGVAYGWVSIGGGRFLSTARLLPGPKRRPVVGDFDADGRDEILWYGAGAVGDSLWTWAGSTFSGQALTVAGTFEPLVGDFDGNGRDDIFWYGVGAAADRLWLHAGSGARISKTFTIGGPYEPLTGDFNGDGLDDLVWYRPGVGADYAWFATGGGAFASTGLVVTDTYQPVVVDLDGDARDDVVWHKPDSTADLWTRWSPTRDRNSVPLPTKAPHQAIVGRFSADGGDGIFWYQPGSTVEAVWYR